MNKKRCKPDYKLKIGDQVRVPPVRLADKSEVENFISQSILQRVEKSILFENKHLMVIDKPSGLAVHSGTGVSFGVVDIIRKMRADDNIDLVHRLDRDTSGCLLIAKHRQSLLAIQACFKAGSIGKFYLAAVKGRWPAAITEISKPLKKAHLPNGERRVYVDPDGQKAITRIIQIEAGSKSSLLTIELLTGRTHQIRVHCQSEGHEIAGDTKYADLLFNREMKSMGIKRLMLHATRLEMPKTEFCDEIVINTKLPAEFARLIELNV